MRHTRWIWAPKPQSPATVCPPATVDGSEIFPGSTCTLIAADGAVYQFDGVGPTTYPNFSGDWEFTKNGVGQTSAIALERNTGGQIYMLQQMGPVSNPFTLWFGWTLSKTPQAVSPASGSVGNVFLNLTRGTSYPTGRAMIADALAGETLQIPLMPNGITQWWDAGTISVANLTIKGVTGAIYGGDNDLSQASLVALANNLTVSNLIMAYGNVGNPAAAVRADNTFNGLTVTGCTIHDYDHGILTGSSAGGTTTVTNTTIFNCGDISGRQTHGSTHNAYIGNEDAVNVQNVTSYRTVSGGHCWKTRAKSGNIGTTSGCIFAQLGGDSTCAIDIPCGGTYVVQNSILHRGPNAENNRFTTFGVEIQSVGNCDMVGRSQSLIFDNCWFIDDGPLNSSATQICQNSFVDTGVIVQLRNGCRVVSNPNTSPVVFGSNVSDDGTTKHYASRAAAIAAGENIPASYSDSLSCLPPVPTTLKLKATLQGMASGSWKTLTAGTDPFTAAALPRTKANFDGNGSTWTSDAAVGNNPMSGIGAATIASIWSYSGAAISPDTLFVTYAGGGHNDSGDGSVYGLDPTRSNGNDLTWSLLQPSCRYIDAFTNGRPTSVQSPAGAVEGAPTTPTAQNQSYWVYPNKNGDTVPSAGHSYYYNKYIPGTHSVTMSRIGGFNNPGGAPPAAWNAGYAFNDQTDKFTGPIVDTGTTGFGQSLGYLPDDGVYTSYAVNDLDGSLWCLVKTSAQHICQITSPLTASMKLIDTGHQLALNNWNGNEGGSVAMFPDPTNTANRAMFQHFNGALDSKFSLITGINGTTYSGIILHEGVSYGAGSVTTQKDTNGTAHLDYAYDSNRGVLWMWDGLNLFQITPNQTVTSFGITSVSAAGDTWAADTTPSHIPRLQYNRAYDCLIAVNQAIVKVFKPANWNPTI